MATIGNGVLSVFFLQFHAFALLVAAVSSLCVAAVAFGHFRRIKSAIDDYRRGTLLACVVLLLLGVAGLVGAVAVYSGLGAVAVAELGASLTVAVAAIVFCVHVPAVASAPQSKELVEANQQLIIERKARNEVVETLTRLNNELELRVLSRTQQLEEAKRRFESALAGTHIMVVEQDRDLRFTWIHNPPAGYPSENIIGSRPEQILPEAAVDVDVKAKRRVLETGVAEVVEISLELQGETRWYEERIEAVLKEDEIAGVVTVSIDITSHKRYEQHLHRLLREITHRSKNLLAVVQGIARQTAESVDTPQEFIARFGARLQALSGAHDLLVRQAWQGVELRDLVMRELESFLPKVNFRVSVAGDSEILGVDVAQNLALGLHEMATNALAHGSLSGTTGRVDISWHRVRKADRDLVELRWIESGGPPIAEPVNRGFGRSLIERLVPRAIEGDSEIAFDPSGLRWTLRFPVERHSEVA